LRRIQELLVWFLVIGAVAGTFYATSPSSSSETRQPGVVAAARRGGHRHATGVVLPDVIDANNVRTISPEWVEESGR
jgi:hypothetical protein